MSLYAIAISIKNKGTPHILVEEAFETYKSICEKYLIEPHANSSFRNYIRQLIQLKVLNSKRGKIDDLTYGRQIRISLSEITPQKLIELLEVIILRKFI